MTTTLRLWSDVCKYALLLQDFKNSLSPETLGAGENLHWFISQKQRVRINDFSQKAELHTTVTPVSFLAATCEGPAGQVPGEQPRAGLRAHSPALQPCRGVMGLGREWAGLEQIHRVVIM